MLHMIIQSLEGSHSHSLEGLEDCKCHTSTLRRIAFIIFGGVEKFVYDYKVLSPNAWTLIRLVIIHPSTTATCGRSFSLMKFIKSEKRTTITGEGLNPFSIINPNIFILVSHVYH